MKLKILFLSLLISIVFSSFYQIDSYVLYPNSSHPISKSLRKTFFDGMKFIHMGSYASFGNHYFTITDADSTLVMNYTNSQVCVQAFYLSDHEVKNKEYRAFIRWSKNKMAHEFLVKHYPKYVGKDGEFNRDMKIDWGDSLLQEALFYDESRTFYHERVFNHELLKYKVSINGITDEVFIYPDTNIWVRSYQYCEPMTQNYFWHPAYDNYPVVGVSWKQAQAYCQWRTDRLNENVLIGAKVLSTQSDNFSTDEFLNDTNNRAYFYILFPSFRLPTESEWEYAAVGSSPRDKSVVYPWGSGKLIDEYGKYYANFGPIRDVNNVKVKQYIHDGGLNTLIVAHYKPNIFGLYDMAGNVAEWQQDAYPQKWTYGNYDGLNEQQVKMRTDSMEQMLNTTIVNVNDDLESAKKKIYYQSLLPKSYHDFCKEGTKDAMEELERLALAEMHSVKVVEAQKPARIIKGGSWADGPLYLQYNTRTIMSENSSSPRVGFRVAMSF